MAYNSIKEKLDKNPNTRGLAVIITNDYDTCPYPDVDPLPDTYNDGREMERTFTHHKFVTHWEHNVTRRRHLKLMDDIVKSDHPRSYNYKCIVFVFSGHGARNILWSNDGAAVDLTRDVIQKLTCELQLVTTPKIFFIDACREGVGIGQGSTMGNFLVAYATSDGMVSYESTEPPWGGVWLQRLARRLRESHDSVQGIVETVKQEVRKLKSFEGPQVPDSMNHLNCGPIHLQVRMMLVPLNHSISSFCFK